MTSDAGPTEAFVWVWLPGETGPVVAGRLAATGNQLLFNYGRSYLARKNAIPLYEPELPLRAGVLPLLNGLHMPSCIRDAAPDAWGRRVILNRKLGVQGRDVDAASLDELTYLLESGSDRIGALDFQTSAAKYVARDATPVSLDDLMNAAASIEKGLPLAPELDRALLHGSSIGGARPKAMLTSGDRKYVAKFSSQSDLYSVVKAEYVAMRLAAESGITVAHVALERTAGKDVLLVERFDREKSTAGWQRRAMVSALTLLELDELMARYASYEDLATIIRHRFMTPRETLRELFSRMLFNILCGNTDDHARNHAAFWDGQSLALTPAYDICPQARAGGEATQAMLIAGNERWSRIVLCLDAAPLFLLSRRDAMALAEHQITVIRDGWVAICAEADLSEVDRNLLWRRQFLNPFAFEGAPPSLLALLA
ncbi:type II toxin-antitoxin system HipA family toxin [Xanthobacter sp. ZOL 2024]